MPSRALRQVQVSRGLVPMVAEAAMDNIGGAREAESEGEEDPSQNHRMIPVIDEAMGLLRKQGQGRDKPIHP